jgi:hypothetical protein
VRSAGSAMALILWSGAMAFADHAATLRTRPNTASQRSHPRLRGRD